MNVKKNAQKMKKYNLNNNMNGKKVTVITKAQRRSFEALKRNVTTQKRKKNRAYTDAGEQSLGNADGTERGENIAQKEKEDEETDPATEAQARPSRLLRRRKRKEESSSANSKISVAGLQQSPAEESTMRQHHRSNALEIFK